MLSGRTTTREPSKACEHRRREQAQWRELNKGLNSRAEQPGLCHLCRQGPELRPPGSGRVPRAAHTLSSRTVPCALVPREATSPGHRPEGGGPDPEMSTTPGVGELGSDTTQSGSVAHFSPACHPGADESHSQPRSRSNLIVHSLNKASPL